MKVQLDPSGRITLPAELRSLLGLKENDELWVELQADGIVLKKAIPGCLFCGRTDRLIHVGKYAVCSVCVRRLSEAKEGDSLYGVGR